jgi:hypothetical protein
MTAFLLDLAKRKREAIKAAISGSPPQKVSPTAAAQETRTTKASGCDLPVNLGYKDQRRNLASRHRQGADQAGSFHPVWSFNMAPSASEVGD